jgi:hypothetical protein
MRGMRAKVIRRFALRLFIEAKKDEKLKAFCESRYMHNEKTGQIICSGWRGIYKSLKRMYMRNEEVAA